MFLGNGDTRFWDRRVLCYYVCLFLCVWSLTRKGDWILKFSDLPPIPGDSPLWGENVSHVLLPCGWKLENLGTISDRASLVAHTVKSLPAMQETRVPSPGRDGLPEKDMATRSRTRP